MKRIVLLLIVVTIAFTSCSKSEEALVEVTPAPNVVLLRTGNIDGAISNFTYTGNKLNERTSGTKRYIYTYTGDLISRIEYINGTTHKDYKDFTYEGGDLKTYIQDVAINNYKTKRTYTYNANGTVTYVSVSVDKTTGAETSLGSGTFNFVNGNFVKDYSASSNQPVTGVTTNNFDYIFDNKNSPYKNILGFNKLITEIEICSVNNFTKETLFNQYTGNSGTTRVITYEYEYNSDGYPTKRTEKDSNNVVLSTMLYTY
jgi:hypothetical protein